MARIDEFASQGAKQKGGMDEHKSTNWRGVKLQLTTRNVLQPFQIQNFQKLLNIRNDDEMIHLPTFYNLLLRAFQSDAAKQRDIKNTFVKSFGSDSIVGGRDFNTMGLTDAKLKKFEAEMTASPEVDSMVDHIVKSSALIKSATASGIYDTESVITNLNTLMADIQKVVSHLSDQGQAQPVPGEEQPGGEDQPTESRKKMEVDMDFRQRTIDAFSDNQYNQALGKHVADKLGLTLKKIEKPSIFPEFIVGTNKADLYRISAVLTYRDDKVQFGSVQDLIGNNIDRTLNNTPAPQPKR